MDNNNNHSITLVHSITNQSVTIPIDSKHPFIPAIHCKQINVTPENPPPTSKDDFVGLTIYDPGFFNTVSCRSKISLVDGQSGKLYYRGYDIEDLYANSSFTEVAYLLIYGELPTSAQFERWQSNILRHTYLHIEMEKQLAKFRWDAHPMGMLIASLSSLSSFHPDANPALVGDALYISGPRDQFIHYYKLGEIRDVNATGPTALEVCEYIRNKQVYRILGKIHTIAANVYRHREGRPFNRPQFNPKSITENFLYMVDKLNEPEYVPDPKLVHIMDKAFVLLAEHGSSCSTIMMRHLISSGVDPCTAISGACGTLFGERKAGAVISMLELIHTVDSIPVFLMAVKEKHTHLKPSTETSPSSPPLRLMGWGHRIYKGSKMDPRVTLMRELAFQCFRHVHGSEPDCPSNHLIYLAIQLEKNVLSDPYFVTRNLNPNIDYWTAILFHTMGFPKDMFPVLMSIPRSAGYLAHFIECVNAKEQIYRPRQVYIGPALCDFIPVNARSKNKEDNQNPTLPIGPSTLETMSLRSNPGTNLRRIDPKSTPQLEDVTAQINKIKLEIAALAQCMDEGVKQDNQLMSSDGQPPRTLKQWIASVQKRVTKSKDTATKESTTTSNMDLSESTRLDKKRAELQELLGLQQELIDVQNQLRGTKLD